jgi:antirestriction protein ArdC
VKCGTFERENSDSGEEECIRYLKAYRVFNVDQIDGLSVEFNGDRQVDTGTRPVAELEAFFSAVDAEITHGGTRACYNINDDRIQMPPVSAFITDRHYYATLAYEVTRWSGHRSRLDRVKSFGDKQDFAFEVLVAEIGACFLGAQIGVEPITEESATHIEHWLKAMRKDKKIIFKAAAHAQRAADYILECAQGPGSSDSKSV